METDSRRKSLGRWDVIGGLSVLLFVALIVRAALTSPEINRSVTEAVLDPSSEVQLGDEWLGLYLKGERVGYAHVNKTRRDSLGYTYQVKTRMKMTVLGQGTSLNVDLSADLSEALELERFGFNLNAGVAEFKGQGQVQGKTLKVDIETGGESIERVFELSRPPTLRDTIGPALSRLPMEPGDTYRFPVFDPVTQQQQTIEIEVIGPDLVNVVDQFVPATHIRQRVSGMVLNAWLNDRGEMLRQELGLGLVAIRETEVQATAQAASGDADLMAATMVTPSGFSARVLEQLPRKTHQKYRLSGIQLKDFDLQNRRQQLDGDVLTVRKETLGDGLKIPALADDGFTSAEPLIQADHPKIRSVSAQIVGPSSDSITATRQIVAWIQKHIAQESVIGVPSALETLSTRRGDCNEVTHLFIALARAAGVPSRLVVGVVLVDGKFGYHAWAEVRTTAGWLSVDPTWNQLPVDVGHIALLRGGLAEQTRILPILGNLKISNAR